MLSLKQRMLAEGIATFVLVFVGAGAVLVEATVGGLGLIGIALAHGLALMTMVYAIGHVSGGHVNPAVTIGMVITRRMRVGIGGMYIVAQLVGAVIAGLMLSVMFAGAPAEAALGTTQLVEGVSLDMAIMIEAVATFILVFVIFGVAVDQRAPQGFGGIAIGLALTLGMMIAGGFTGGAVNPARAFGPAVASQFFVNQAVYWVGPIIGGIVASLVYRFGFMRGVTIQKTLSDISRD